jgi:PLP dependent protein
VNSHGATPLAAAISEVRDRIAAAARLAGRDPASVTLVAASKTVPVDRVAEAVALGVTDIGENRAQDLVTKAGALRTNWSPSQAPAPAATVGKAAAAAATEAPVCWHFLGRLQRNKVRSLAPLVTWWQSVDREELGATIVRHAPDARVLVEVNIGGEPQKGGCAPRDVGRLTEALRGLGLRVEGLMTIPPQHDDPRRRFAELRDLAGDHGLQHLSMGMTDDYEVAVEEGATMVRVGRALFGAR